MSGCGNQAGSNTETQFNPGGETVDISPGGPPPGQVAGPSRFDNVQVGSSAAPVQTARVDNPSRGVGFGNVAGVTTYWRTQQAHGGVGGAEKEFEQLSEAPDALPPFNWSVSDDPYPHAVELVVEGKPQRITVPKSADSPDADTFVFSSAQNGVVALGFNAGKKDKREVWDLMQGEKIGTITNLGVKTTHNAISPDGRYFAGVTSGRGFNKVIGVWDVEEGVPAANIDLGSAPWLAEVAIPRPDLLVARLGDNLMAWDLPSGAPVYETALPRLAWRTKGTFSPGGKYYVIATHSKSHWDETICVFDLDDGLVVGELDLPEYDGGWRFATQGVAFSPDGTELAAVLDYWHCSKVIVWNMSDGSIKDHYTFKQKLAKEVNDDVFATPEPIRFFPGGKYLLAYQIGLIDREVGAGVWKFPGGGTVRTFPTSRWPLSGDRMTMVTGTARQGYLQIQKLPADKIAKVREKMEALVARKPQTPVEIAHADLPQTPDLSSVKFVVPEKTAWVLQPDGVATVAKPYRSVVLETPRGTLRQVAIARDGSPTALAMRSSQYIHHSRLPVGNAAPKELEWHRRTSRPDADDENSASAGGGGSRCWIDLYDLESSKRTKEIRLTYTGDLVTASPDARRFVILDAQTSTRLDVYNTEDSSLVASWIPYHTDFGDLERMVVGAVMPSSEHVVTLSGAGTLTGWQVDGLRPLFSVEHVSQPACSPSGRYVGFSDGRNYYFLEISTGRIVGHVPDVGLVQGVAFHPDGKRIAMVSEHNGGYYLFTVDGTTGVVTPPFPVPVVSPFMRWFGDRYVLLDNTKFVDIEQKAVAWSYELPMGDSLPEPVGNLHYVVAGIGGKPVLKAVQLPEGGVSSRLAGAPLRPEFALKPGDACSLSLQLNHPAIDSGARSRIEKEIREQLARNKIRVADGQPVTLYVTAREDVGETEQLKFRGFGSFEVQEASVTQKRAKLRVAFQMGTETAWEWTGGTGTSTFFVQRKENESISAAIDRIYGEGVSRGFDGVNLPPFVFTPVGANGIGKTLLSPEPPKPTAQPKTSAALN